MDPRINYQKDPKGEILESKKKKKIPKVSLEEFPTELQKDLQKNQDFPKQSME